MPQSTTVQNTATSFTETDASADGAMSVFFVETNPKIATALAAIIGEAGLHGVPCEDVAEVMRRAKEMPPEIVLLDVNLPTSEMAQCVRALARCYQTSSAVVLATCRGAADHEQLSTLISAGVFAPIYPPLNRDNVLETLRMAAAESMSRQADLAAAMGKRASPTRRVPGNNSLLVRALHCPFHDEPVEVNQYILRARCVETESNVFDIAVYKAASRGADYVNFHLPAVMVCPNCLFASIDARYFTDPAEKMATITHTPSTRSAITADTAQRKTIAPDLPPEFFTERRSLHQAMIAYELAIRCSRILFDCNRYLLMNELVRQGNYHLRIAHLMALQGARPQQTREICENAYRALEQGFTVAQPPALYKATYQLVALAIKGANDKTAFQYIQRFNEMERALPENQRGSILPYLTRSRKLWEDRELHRWPEEQAATS